MKMTNAMKDRRQLEAAFETQLETGLTAAMVKQRQAAGRNVLQEEKPPTIWQKNLAAFIRCCVTSIIICGLIINLFGNLGEWWLDQNRGNWQYLDHQRFDWHVSRT